LRSVNGQVEYLLREALAKRGIQAQPAARKARKAEEAHREARESHRVARPRGRAAGRSPTPKRRST